MRFIGSKQNLLHFIEETITKYSNDDAKTLGDLFCGTASVSTHFKNIGYSVTANDNLAFCATLAKASLLNNKEPEFSDLFESGEIEKRTFDRVSVTPYDKVQYVLNNLPEFEGFIYNEYSPGGTSDAEFERLFFTNENAKKIDAIRTMIYEWNSSKLINEAEEALLLADLLRSTNKVANIAGTYGCFMKKWADSRVSKPLTLVRSPIVKSNKSHVVYQMDANELVKQLDCDILYLDPPYNWRHYGAYYHILETIVRWDNPHVKGKTGLRPWKDSKSNYSYRNEALDALTDLVENASSEHIFLSYNSEGLISHEDICENLSAFGELSVEEVPYRRYKSNKGGSQKSTVKERIYYVGKRWS